VREVLARQHEPAEWLSAHLADWYRALYTPPIQAGLIEAAMLAGYRERRVYIRGADHVPPSHEVVPELMETLFDLLRCERDAAVRGVLGHFCFVFIHPYQDGNGRIARFLMNYFLTTAGHPWTVIRKGSDQVGRLSDVRKAYMDALGHASGRGDIQPFAQFVRQEMELCRALLRPMQTETLLPALDGTERHNNFSSISLNSNRF
jgi:Fic family protein